MKTNLNIDESLLVRYFSGEVDQDEKIQIENWITSSDENKKMAKQVYYICFAADTLHTIKNTSTEKALADVSQRMAKQKTVLWKKRLQQIAAILFIPLLFSTIYFAFFSQGEQVLHYVEVRTNPGMITSITLPDSTKVWLNSESYLKYPTEFNSDLRSVELIGEAYFDVEKDAERKFIVKTPDNLQIEVLGTEFNVEAYGNKDIVTTLVSGKVNISYTDENNSKQNVLMSPNQKVVYNTTAKSVDIMAVRVDPDIAWKDGKIIFSDTSLEDALNILGKRFNVEFVIKNSKIKDNRFTGTFVNQRLDVILEHFKVSSNIRFRYIDALQNNNVPEKSKIEIY